MRAVVVTGAHRAESIGTGMSWVNIDPGGAGGEAWRGCMCEGRAYVMLYDGPIRRAGRWGVFDRKLEESSAILYCNACSFFFFYQNIDNVYHTFNVIVRVTIWAMKRAGG